MNDKTLKSPTEVVSHGQSMDEAAADNFGLTADDLDEECSECGGEGFIFDCFDGCCANADIGCDDCTRLCHCQKRQAPRELQDVLSAALSELLAPSHQPEDK